MVTAADLRTHAGAGASISDAVLVACITTAEEAIKTHIADAIIPPATLERAKLLAANECLQQNLSPNGVLNTQYDLGDGATPIRIGRDPLTPVYPLLARYVAPLGFA